MRLNENERHITRGVQMAQYQLYFLSDEDRDVEQQVFSCLDDHSAILVARSLCRDYNIDVWEDGRRVARVNKRDFGLHLRA